MSNSSGDLAIYRRLLSYLWPYLPIFLVSIAGFFLFSSMYALAADLMQYIIDVVQGNGSETNSLIVKTVVFPLLGNTPSDLTTNRLIIAAMILGLLLLRGLGSLIGNYCLAHVSRFVVHNLRCDLFNRLMILPTEFFDHYSSGHLISRITYNVDQVTGAATQASKVIIREGLFVICLLSYLLYLNWRLTLVFVGVSPVIALLVAIVGKRFRRLSKRVQVSMGDVTQVSSEMIGGHRLVRLFGGEDYERQRFNKASNSNRNQNMKMVLVDAVVTPLIQLIVGAALVFIIWWGLDPHFIAEMNAAQFVAFLVAAGMLAKPTRQLTEVYSIVKKGITAAESIFDIIDMVPEANNGKLTVERARGKIEFRHVSFSYGGAAVGSSSSEVTSRRGGMQLEDISFVVEPGQTVALVGQSGSGKSTLVSLIARFYGGYQGLIFLDDIDIKDYELSNLRHQIALVTQQVTLFDDTIYNNIAYGSLSNKTEAEVIEAARAACALEFIEQYEHGIHTMVGDNGVRLSGGQKQRLAIARALLKNAPVLILDEATSALDNKLEASIQQALETVMHGRTTFVIAHRLSTIENADVIMVMHEGRLVERGTHRDLLDGNGYYAALQQTQLSAARNALPAE